MTAPLVAPSARVTHSLLVIFRQVRLRGDWDEVGGPGTHAARALLDDVGDSLGVCSMIKVWPVISGTRVEEPVWEPPATPVMTAGSLLEGGGCEGDKPLGASVRVVLASLPGCDQVRVLSARLTPAAASVSPSPTSPHYSSLTVSEVLYSFSLSLL